MKYSIMVSGAPSSSQSCASALAFAEAVVRRGHELTAVFFYHDGVYLASRLNCPPQDDRDLLQAWQNFAKQTRVPLIACTAAAQRRGILDEMEAARHGRTSANLAEGFAMAGLGQWIEAVGDAERFIHFGA